MTYALKYQAFRLSGVSVTDILPNKWNKQSHKTLFPIALSQTNKLEEREGQLNDGTMVAVI